MVGPLLRFREHRARLPPEAGYEALVGPVALRPCGRRAAAALVVALAGALAIALAPYATGLIGIPVLYVALEPVHDWLARRAPGKAAASLVVALVLLLLTVVGGSSVTLIVSEAQRIPGAIMQSPIVTRLSELR